MGLCCALALADRGFQVTVLEAGEAMREASWAAGGMLAVDDPENPPALHPLSRYSRSLFDPLLARIRSLSGIAVPLRTTQTLQLLRAGERPSLAGHILTAAEARDAVPGLADLHADWLLLEECSLDPRDLCAALPTAVRAAGVTLREHERVERVSHDGRGVLISTAQAAPHADAFLDCCGAWAGRLAQAGPTDSPTSPAIVPRKGQMLVVQEPAGTHLTKVLRSPEIYLIPRGDGRIVIGATVEDAGYSKQVHGSALADLRRRAASLWPAAAHARMLESWAGLRPATPDALPVIGEATEGPSRGVHYIATGHYRNGILLAPGTAACIAALLCGEQPPVHLAPFAPHRAALAPLCDKQFAPAL